MRTSFRVERYSMGEIKVPADALWGAHTQRAVQNFPVSGLTMPRPFIGALGLVKQAECADEGRSEEHTSELQSQSNLVCRLLLEKKIKRTHTHFISYIHCRLPVLPFSVNILGSLIAHVLLTLFLLSFGVGSIACAMLILIIIILL